MLTIKVLNDMSEHLTCLHKKTFENYNQKYEYITAQK